MKLKTKRKIARILENSDELSKIEFTLIYNEMFGIETKTKPYEKKSKYWDKQEIERGDDNPLWPHYMKEDD